MSVSQAHTNHVFTAWSLQWHSWQIRLRRWDLWRWQGLLSACCFAYCSCLGDWCWRQSSEAQNKMHNVRWYLTQKFLKMPSKASCTACSRDPSTGFVMTASHAQYRPLALFMAVKRLWCQVNKALKWKTICMHVNNRADKSETIVDTWCYNQKLHHLPPAVCAI